MACSDYRASRLYRSELDRMLGGFLHPLASAYRHRNGLRICSARCAACGALRAWSNSSQGNQVGTRLARGDPHPLDATEYQCFSLELSLAAVSACGSSAVRRRSIAVIQSSTTRSQRIRQIGTHYCTPSAYYSRSIGDRVSWFDHACFKAFPHLWPTFLPIGLDMPRDRGNLGDTRKDKITRVGAPLRCLRLTTRDLSLSFTQRWRSEIQSCPRTDDASAS